jgi:hypothetical protein
MEEWTIHQQYATADIPTIHEEVKMINNVVPNPVQAKEYIESGAMPMGYSPQPCVQQSSRDKIWQAVAIGTTIAVWAMIMVVVFR